MARKELVVKLVDCAFKQIQLKLIDPGEVCPWVFFVVFLSFCAQMKML